MALFNKLFTNRKNIHNKRQDNISEKLFAFSKDQVRVVLFRECDFRGRKLLFDSSAIKKEPITSKSTEKFAEISNGFGYVYTKPQSDFNQLSEMVFGSVAMSFRGTYFKIHSLIEPKRFMLTQVFPSPRQTSTTTTSTSSNRSRIISLSSRQSFEHSNKLLDDSGASSNNSISEQLSVHSTVSDTILICRHLHSSPLDVPTTTTTTTNQLIATNSNPCIIIGDSGCCCIEHSSYYSGGSCASSNLSMWESLFTNQSYKRWLRHTSTSLDQSINSDDYQKQSQHHHRTSKLGLAIIIELTITQEDDLSEFLMEHVALLESMLWRARQIVELAYMKTQNFLSLMMDVTILSSKWLVSLLSGSYLSMNLWLSLSSNNIGCDNSNSISAFNGDLLLRSTSSSVLEMNDDVRLNFIDRNFNSSFNGLSSLQQQQQNESFFNIGKYLKATTATTTTTTTDNNNKINSSDLIAEQFIHEFCELLEAIDIKDTKFFMSTLVTAVLTYHLGWVATCLPTTTTTTQDLDMKNPYNSLWDQLSDLYGAIGHPTKIAQTIITGTNKKDIITKMLNSLTYFIRCCDVERKHIIRPDITEENKIVETICHKYSCIPKENYKKYEDHLREIMATTNTFLNSNKKNNMINSQGDDEENVEENVEENIELKTFTTNNKLKIVLPSPHIATAKKGLIKTQTCLTSLSDLSQTTDDGDDNNYFYPSSTKEIALKVNKLCRVPSSTVLCHMNSEESSSGSLVRQQQSIHNSICSKIIEQDKKQMSSNDAQVLREEKEEEVEEEEEEEKEEKGSSSSSSSDNVIFVLGDDEELVGLKKQKRYNKRPNYLDLSQQEQQQQQSIDDFKDCDFIKYEDNSQIKPSTSWTSLQLAEKQLVMKSSSTKKIESNPVLLRYDKYTRSQSMPPEDHHKSSKINEINNDNKTKPKFRYSGVKFSLQQYPQILSNYMKTKNLEMSNLHLGDKSLMFDQMTTLDDHINSNLIEFKKNYEEEEEALQTPSNATELEFTSDLFMVPSTKESSSTSSNSNSETNFFKRNNISTIIIKELVVDDNNKKKSVNRCNFETDNNNCVAIQKMKITNLPMPKSISLIKSSLKAVGYSSSLMRAVSDCYMPDMVLQGTSLPKNEWESKLKNDLALASHHSLIDQPVQEAVAIVANTDTWEVQLISSHTYVIDKDSSGIRVGMSQLVANMLESLLQMWKLKVPPQYCLMHIEQRLQEMCIRSKALAQLLLATEFCSMELLTSTLHLEVNDVPLLLAVASTHSPQVTEKYGLSFQ